MSLVFNFKLAPTFWAFECSNIRDRVPYHHRHSTFVAILRPIHFIKLELKSPFLNSKLSISCFKLVVVSLFVVEHELKRFPKFFNVLKRNVNHRGLSCGLLGIAGIAVSAVPHKFTPRLQGVKP